MMRLWSGSDGLEGKRIGAGCCLMEMIALSDVLDTLVEGFSDPRLLQGHIKLD